MLYIYNTVRYCTYITLFLFNAIMVLKTKKNSKESIISLLYVNLYVIYNYKLIIDSLHFNRLYHFTKINQYIDIIIPQYQITKIDKKKQQIVKICCFNVFTISWQL